MSRPELGPRAAPWLVLGALLAACPEPPPPRPPPPPLVRVADLVECAGTVTLERGAAPGAPAAPGPLYVGDVVATGPNSRALLRSLEKQELELGENTRFRVGERLGKVSLEIQQGVLTFEGGDGAGVAVTTRYGQAALPGGAKGSLTVGQDGLHASLTLGAITLTEEDGGSMEATAGQRVSLTLGKFALTEDAPADAGAPDAGVGSASLSMRWVVERGSPMLKGAGETKFHAAAGATQLAPGTAFKLPPGGRARLLVEGLSVDRGPTSTGTVGAASRTADGVALDLGLESGTSTMRFDGPAAVKLGPTTMRATRAATATATRSRQGLAVDVLVGDVDIASGGDAQQATSGQRAVVSAKKVTVLTRPRPSLALPLDRRHVVHGALAEVALVLPDEPTRVEVATDSSFENPLLVGFAKGALPVQVGGHDALFVRTLDEQGHATHQGSVLFRADTATAGSGQRSEVIGETGQLATLYFQGEVPSLTFAFAEREGAKRYRLKVFAAANLKKVLLERDVTTNRCTVEPGALPEGSFVWYAAALTDSGTELGGGAMNKFDLKFDNELTTLTIIRPLNGEQASATTQAAGAAPLKARLFINGRAVTLDAQGRFSTPVGAVELVTFRMLTADGTEGYWIRRLRR